MENVHGKLVGRTSTRHQTSEAVCQKSKRLIFVNIIQGIYLFQIFCGLRCTGIFRVFLILRVVAVNEFLLVGIGPCEFKDVSEIVQFH